MTRDAAFMRRPTCCKFTRGSRFVRVFARCLSVVGQSGQLVDRWARPAFDNANPSVTKMRSRGVLIVCARSRRHGVLKAAYFVRDALGDHRLKS